MANIFISKHMHYTHKKSVTAISDDCSISAIIINKSIKKIVQITRARARCLVKKYVLIPIFII